MDDADWPLQFNHINQPSIKDNEVSSNLSQQTLIQNVSNNLLALIILDATKESLYAAHAVIIYFKLPNCFDSKLLVVSMKKTNSHTFLE